MYVFYLLMFKLSMSILISYLGIVKSLPSNSGLGFIFILALALIGPNTEKWTMLTTYIIYFSFKSC